MENGRIKLPLSLGLEVSKILSNQGILPRSNRSGMLTLEYTKEELEKVDTIEIINPSRNILKGLTYLTNLKTLKISTLINTRYRQNKSIASISSKDLDLISKLNSLESLEIINQNGIHSIDVSNMSNLKTLILCENENLEQIVGLENLRCLENLSIYENKNLFYIPILNEVIKNNPLKSLELSLLYFSDSLKYDRKTLNMDMDSLSIMHKLGSNAKFLEVPANLKRVIITPTEALKFHQMSIMIIDSKFDSVCDTIGYIIGVEDYLTRNINYDYDAISHEYTHRSELRKVGPINGSNSAYNAIMFKSATGEGYARAMVYLLKQLGIKSHIVNCHKNNLEDLIPCTYPDDGFHAVVSINDYYNLYCDPLWDSASYCNGDAKSNYLPFTLLSKEEISKTHSLMYDEKSTGNETLTVPRKIISTYLNSKEIGKRGIL